jgi:poly(3-hydroxybutyrate) depolymerase
MSSGAALAAAICAHHPGLFAGAMYHSGLAYRASESAMGARQVLGHGPVGDVTLRIDPAPSPSTLIIHGDADDVVALSHADELMRQTLAQDGRIRPGEPLPDPDRIARQRLKDRAVSRAYFGRHQMMTIAGLQHAWSGSEEDLPYFDRHGPSALALASTFFDNPAPIGCR